MRERVPLVTPQALHHHERGHAFAEPLLDGLMAKSRDDRYQSAQAFADDLQRYLEGLPTLCKRPSILDRAGKWSRRHRSLVATAACAFFLVSVISVVGMVVLAREQARTSAALKEVERNAESSQRNFERAKRHLQTARAVVDRDASASKSRNNPYHGRDLPDPVVATVWAGRLTHRR